MNHTKLTGKGILGIATILFISGQASAKQEQWTEIDAEINSCVEVVAERANYDDATRVMHAVVGVKERTVGYKLTIETSLYNENSDSAIREYATSCVVNGNNIPLQFSISESMDDV
ncbi:MAG: hypothetical protein ACR2QL_03070 [Woeseiaceae bacterium]